MSRLAPSQELTPTLRVLRHRFNALRIPPPPPRLSLPLASNTCRHYDADGATPSSSSASCFSLYDSILSGLYPFVSVSPPPPYLSLRSKSFSRIFVLFMQFSIPFYLDVSFAILLRATSFSLSLFLSCMSTRRLSHLLSHTCILLEESFHTFISLILSTENRAENRLGCL